MRAMRLCPFCATENEAFFRFCLGCGADLDDALGGTVEAEAVLAPAAALGPSASIVSKAKPAAVPSAPPASRSKSRPAPAPSAAGSGSLGGSAAAGQAAPARPSLAAGLKSTLPRGSELRAKTAEAGSRGTGTPAAKAVANANSEAAAARAQKQAPDAASAPGTPLRAPSFAKAEGSAHKRGVAEVAPAVAKKGAAQKVRARLVMILEDGSDGQTIDVVGETVTIGREGSDITFPQDDFLAARHAELASGTADGLVLRPLESTNGVFLQVHEETELVSGDVFRIGQQLLSFEVLSEVAGDHGVDPRGGAERLGSPVPEGAWGRLGQIIAPGLLGSVYLLGGNEVYLGRERGDITFPGDGFVSGLHALVSARGGQYFLKDLGSSNGTYLRLSREAAVGSGALVLAGQQLFRIEL
jgi:pSer/pThr/pTyr-binding forkhead associated (FHA) protein